MLLNYSNFKRLHEAAEVTINGRSVRVGPNGTVLVKDASGKDKKVRLSTAGIAANIVSIKYDPNEDEYEVCSKSGRCETLSKEKAAVLVSFVDKGAPTEIKSGSVLKPNVALKIES